MLDVAELRSQVANHTWFHSIDLGQGVVTPGSKSTSVLAKEAAAFFDSVALGGRSLLDVGAWNGFFSFEAKRRGATVLATDSMSWNSPSVKGLETFRLCRSQLGLDVPDRTVDVDDLPSAVEPHDVVLFAGVLYHRIDAVRSIASVAAVTRHLLILETHQDAAKIEQPAMIYYPGSELNNDETNWWGPNTRCVDGLLREHGFEVVFYRDSPVGGGRGIFHAFKSRRAVSLLAPDIERHAVDLSVAPPWRDMIGAERGLEMAKAQITDLKNQIATLERTLQSRSALLKRLVRAILRKATR